MSIECMIYGGNAPDTSDQLGVGRGYETRATRGGAGLSRSIVRGDTLFTDALVRFADRRSPHVAHVLATCFPADSGEVLQLLVQSIERLH